MGEMRISDSQAKLLTLGGGTLKRVQDENNIMLAAILAGANVTEAKNVQHNGNILAWDDPPNEDEGPALVPDGDVLKEPAEALTKEVAASEQPGPEQAGESKGPEVNAPESESAVEEGEPAVAPA